jgi:hypothetical protein
MPISTGSKDRTEVRAADRRILAGSNPRSEHVTHACLIEFFHQPPQSAALPVVGEHADHRGEQCVKAPGATLLPTTLPAS